jgi:hypothetical protein
MAPSCRGLCGGCGRLEPVSEFRSSRLGSRRLLCCKAKPVERVFHFFIFVRDHTTVAEGEALTLVASGEKSAPNLVTISFIKCAIIICCANVLKFK